ncbi:MAG: N-acetylmuramoyl-L-alanine amidase, partial [Flavobacteriales bacterium]|nr:N-acetylmuramoyl-L-alanine amidase [Flavobacteriales bacterium]
GLEGVEEYRSAGLYRYTYGNATSLADARALQQECRDKGFDGAFIVAYQGTERIDLQEALKLAQGH